jgi:hypothetical protein
MANRVNEFVFSNNETIAWMYSKYYYCGSNSRYWTFQIALNLLAQKKDSPVIIETGCQRLPDDLGAGMSSSIFGEYCSRYGGILYSIDLITQHLEVCKECTKQFSHCIEYVNSDSVAWLRSPNGIVADLLYLDSLDYPISADGTRSLDPDGEFAAQAHCLNEFIAALDSGKVNSKTIVLLDDNQLPGGGKPKLLKDFLLKKKWTCLLDFQQSLWVKEL